MNKFVYDVYYTWDGRNESSVLGTQKTPYQIEDALRSFHGEMAQNLADLEAHTVITPVDHGTTQVRLTVSTVLPRAAVDAALTHTLRDWDLRGTVIES